jgi:hypothetical protein
VKIRTRANANRLAIIAAAFFAVVIAASTAGATSVPTQTPAATATLTAENPSIISPTSTLTIDGTLDGSQYFFNDSPHESTDELKVLDPGGGAGWHVTGTMTAFTCQSASCGCTTMPATPCTAGDSGVDELTGMSITEDSASAWDDTTPPTPTCTSTSCITPTAGTTGFGQSISTTATPTTIYSANNHTGVGAFTFPTLWWVSVPSDVRQGSYTSTVTLNIASGP